MPKLRLKMFLRFISNQICRIFLLLYILFAKHYRNLDQPRPQSLLLIQNDGSEKPLAKAAKMAPKIHDTMKCLLFVWTMVSVCKKTNRVDSCWKQPLEKPFHHVSGDKILHYSCSISAVLARGFSDLPFWLRRRPWRRGWIWITQNFNFTVFKDFCLLLSWKYWFSQNVNHTKVQSKVNKCCKFHVNPTRRRLSKSQF